MLVAIERWKYPFPFRTRKSSTPSPMILPFGGKVGRCQLFFCTFQIPSDSSAGDFFYPKIFSKSTQILINHENFKKGIPDLNSKILFLNHSETTSPCCSLVRVGEGIEPPTQRRKVHFRSLVQVIPFKVAHRSRAFSGIIQGVLSLESSWHSY